MESGKVDVDGGVIRLRIASLPSNVDGAVDVEVIVDVKRDERALRRQDL